MKFCFVILHYRTDIDTIECVKSILSLDQASEIVIVDNASQNGSIERVTSTFNEYSNITILKNKNNLGFASGNNIGYQYARNVLKSDFIAVINNDIIISSKDLISAFTKLYEETHYGVAGPDIVSMIDHGHQNPKPNTIPGIIFARKEIIHYSILYALSKLGIYDILKKRYSTLKNENISSTISDSIVKNTMLHGAFVVFSPSFIAAEEYCFRPGTFLYVEEDILYRYCQKHGYEMVFTPFIEVFHKEDSATNSMFDAPRQKREFVFLNLIKSLRVYCRVLKEK